MTLKEMDVELKIKESSEIHQNFRIGEMEDILKKKKERCGSITEVAERLQIISHQKYRISETHISFLFLVSGLVSLFNGISTFVGYLMSNLSL